MDKNFNAPVPILDSKEQDTLTILTERYTKLSQPSKIAELGTKVGQLVPQKIRKWGSDIGTTITEQELYAQMMEVMGSGFKAIEEQAAKFSIDEKQIIAKINKNSEFEINQLDQICLLRSYDIAKLVDTYKSIDMITAAVEGGGTGVFGFWGLPFNIVLSTFLYFRAVQSIAMYYGYNTKSDSAEMIIASEVFTSALAPNANDSSNEATNIIVKIMMMSQAAVVKQTAKKTWTDMAARGGIPLLLAQMRALANKSAQKALQKAGAKGLENSIFREAFEQIGRKITLKAIGKAVPIVSGVMGALIDTAQMKKVLEYADVFYHKRFILEKESRIAILMGEEKTFTNAEVIDEEMFDSRV